MVEYSVRVEGLKELQKMLSKAPHIVQKHLRRAMDRSVKDIQRKLQEYPTGKPGPMVFTSDKQRRYFFWALRQGKIQVPYRRTGTLGRKWKTRVTGADRIQGIVENPTPYAPMVQGDEQAAIHRGRWEPASKIVEKREKQVRRFHEDAIRDAIREMESGK